MKLRFALPLCAFLLISCEGQRNTLSGHWYSEQGLFNTQSPTDWYFSSRNNVMTVSHLPYIPDSVVIYTYHATHVDSCATKDNRDVYRTMSVEIKDKKMQVDYCDKSYEYDCFIGNDTILIYDVHGAVTLGEMNNIVLIRMKD